MNERFEQKLFQLLRAMGSIDIHEKSKQLFIDRVKTGMGKIPSEQIPPGYYELINKLLVMLSNKLDNINAEMKTLSVEKLSQLLDEDQTDQLIEFFESDIGNCIKEFNKEMVPVTFEKMQEFAKEIMDDTMKSMEKEIKKLFEGGEYL